MVEIKEGQGERKREEERGGREGGERRVCWGKTNTNSTDCREWDTLSWTQRQKEKEMWTQRKIDRGVEGVCPTPSPSTTACLFGVAFICLTLFYHFSVCVCACVCVCLFVCLACLAVCLFSLLPFGHCPLASGCPL